MNHINIGVGESDVTVTVTFNSKECPFNDSQIVESVVRSFVRRLVANSTGLLLTLRSVWSRSSQGHTPGE